MKGIIQSVRNGEWVSMAAAVVAGTFLVVSLANATTTISTDITTGGAVYASTTVQSDVSIVAYGTLQATGLTTLVNASTTRISASGTSFFTGLMTLANASTSVLSTSGASFFTGDATFGHASTTQLTSSGTIWQTTGNSATTTASLGCIQTTATSTATPIKLTFYATTTLSGTTLTPTNGGTTVGLAVFTFGNCP